MITMVKTTEDILYGLQRNILPRQEWYTKSVDIFMILSDAEIIEIYDGGDHVALHYKSATELFADFLRRERYNTIVRAIYLELTKDLFILTFKGE